MFDPERWQSDLVKEKRRLIARQRRHAQGYCNGGRVRPDYKGETTTPEFCSAAGST
jgi:hypothetical protein